MSYGNFFSPASDTHRGRDETHARGSPQRRHRSLRVRAVATVRGPPGVAIWRSDHYWPICRTRERSLWRSGPASVPAARRPPASVPGRSTARRLCFELSRANYVHSDAASQGGGWWQGCGAAYSRAWSRIDCARSPFFWKQLRRLRTWRAHTSLTGTGVTISSDHGMP